MTFTTLRTLAAAVATGLALAAGAASADEMDVSTMTCADFMAMDDAGMMSAMEAIEAAHAAMATDSMAATDDAMATDTMATDTMATDTMATGDAMASANPMVAEIMTGCEGHPEMMASDAMAMPAGN